MRVSVLPVSELFYSIQGEGKTMGMPAVFLRLGGCNLTCGGKGTLQSGRIEHDATWRCDTIDVWTQFSRLSFDALYSRFIKEGYVDRLQQNAHLIITGGEPLLYQKELIEFLKYFEQQSGFLPLIEIETNGTICPIPELVNKVSFFNVSPKLSNSGMLKVKRFNEDILRFFSTLSQTQFKFVVACQQDLDELLVDFVEFLSLKSDKVTLMPAADSRDSLLLLGPVVCAFAKDYGFHFSSRLHVLLWDKKTGV